MKTMKKITKMTTALLALFLFTLTINAQNKISFVTGLHSANISAEGINVDFLNMSSINRLSAGITFERELDKFLTLKTGVIYKQKGFKIAEVVNVDAFDIPLPLGVKATTEVNTLDIPLMIKYDFKNSSNITPFISVGPNFSYALSGAVNTKATALIDFTIASIPLELGSDSYNRLGVEGMIAGGFSVPYGKGSITAEVNYSHALNDFTSDSFLVDTGIRNRGVGFSIGYGMYF